MQVPTTAPSTASHSVPLALTTGPSAPASSHAAAPVAEAAAMPTSAAPAATMPTADVITGAPTPAAAEPAAAPVAVEVAANDAPASPPLALSTGRLAQQAVGALGLGVPTRDQASFNCNFSSPASKRAWERQQRSKRRMEQKARLAATPEEAVGGGAGGERALSPTPEDADGSGGERGLGSHRLDGLSSSRLDGLSSSRLDGLSSSRLDGLGSFRLAGSERDESRRGRARPLAVQPLPEEA